MKPYKLVVDYEAIQFMQALPPAGRKDLHQRLVRLREHPHDCRDATVLNRLDRDYFIYAGGRFAIKFWIDEWEREIRVIDVWLR
jgi:hypothetical protein